MLRALLIQFLVICVETIDRNERAGPCTLGEHVPLTKFYVNENEGVWFPQYRNHQPENEKFSCHTVYEKMIYEDHKFELQVESYYAMEKQVLKTAYIQTYSQERRGLLVDQEYFPGYGPYKIKIYILKLTPKYRVRYVCTDYKMAGNQGPVVYIETRNMTPSQDVIAQAVKDIKAAGISVKLDRIHQRNCTRPINDDGYSEDVLA